MKSLEVVLNSSDKCNRRLIANTCTAMLHISRRYISVEDFKEEFDIYLNDAYSMQFD